MTASPPEVDARPLWRVAIVQVSSGERSETYVKVRANTPFEAWLAAQELPGLPAESDTCHYATPVRVRTPEPAVAS